MAWSWHAFDDPLCATVICDAPIWEIAGRAAQIPPNPQLLAASGTLHKADTIEALAEAAGLMPENLTATVADYNDAVRFNRLVTLLPERSTRSGAPRRSTREFGIALTRLAAREPDVHS